MAKTKNLSVTNVFMGKLQHGADLLEELTQFCVEKEITLGWIHALGAVQKAKIGFYDQSKKEYQFLDIDKPLEITNLCGNVSLKNGKPIVHAHITLADGTGQAFGGHLAPGTIIFACECKVQALNGDKFERGFDEQTGLPLWEMQ